MATTPLKLNSTLDVVNAVLPYLQDTSGQWTPFAAASQLYDTVQIRTNITPPVTINVRELGGASGPNPVAQKIQPTIVLSGPLGQKVLAPYGAASEITGTLVGIWGTMALVGGFGLFAFLAGRAVERGKQRRRSAAKPVSGLAGLTRKRKRR